MQFLYVVPAVSQVRPQLSSKLLATVVGTGLLVLSTSANAGLLSRLNGQAFYDDELDITWLADANMNGSGTWDEQMAWAASFEIGGVTGWRLPNMDVNGDGVVVDCSDPFLDAESCKDHELGYMYHWHHITPDFPGSFVNVWPSRYWSNVEVEQYGQPDYAYSYHYRSAGNNNVIAPKASPSGSAWLVYDGDIGGALIDITGYDIALTPRSGSGGWAHYYTGTIAPSGVHGYLYTYTGGTGTMADGVIGTSVDESHYFAMGFEFDPEVPEITVYLDGLYEISHIEVYGGNFSNGAPGNLYGMDITVGGLTESYLSEEFGISYGLGPVNDRVTLSATQTGIGTNQLTISKFLWDPRVNATSVAEIRVYGSIVPNVNIDVIPGDAANQVYPNKGGKVPVAILSGPEFDALQVDPDTIRFGAGEAAPDGLPVVSQVDGQHGDDIVVRFPMAATGIFCNDTEVVLQGETYAGESIQGTDSIDASECEDGGCHSY